MMDRRRFLLTSLAGAVAASIAAEAQQAGKVYRLGVMSPRAVSPFIGQFGSAMRSHGWVEGRDFTLEQRYSGLNTERAQAAARELIDLKVDLILTFTTAQAHAAQQASRTVPIIMITSGFPVEAGLAASLARPGANVTGLSVYAGGGLFAKYLELLKDLMPHLKRFGVLWNYVPPGFLKEEAAVGLGEIRQAAVALGVVPQVFEIDSRAALNQALNDFRESRVEAIFVTSGGPLITEEISAEIIAFTVQHRIATITDFASGAFFNAGSLMTYSASLAEITRRGAAFADRVLRGARPGDLPIELPTKFELVINRKTAKALGLTIPPSLLARADQVIE
jgi:putative ABC transport system substrate-binding protein